MHPTPAPIVTASASCSNSAGSQGSGNRCHMLGAVLSTYINHPRAQQTPAYMMTVGYMALPGGLKQLSLKGISLAGLLGATTGMEGKCNRHPRGHHSEEIWGLCPQIHGTCQPWHVILTGTLPARLKLLPGVSKVRPTASGLIVL